MRIAYSGPSPAVTHSRACWRACRKIPGLFEPTPSEFFAVRREFGLHELAVEDHPPSADLLADRANLRVLGGDLAQVAALESHGPGLVAILEGLPAGLPVSVKAIGDELTRRRQGYGRGPRMKIEKDSFEITSGGGTVPTPGATPTPTPTPACNRTIKADVVALDQAIMYNRLGAMNPHGMIYALKQDVVPIDAAKGLVAGNVRLRSDKRPRPIVLRMNSNDCLRITFTNLLSPTPLKDQPATRSAGIHVIGMEPLNIGSDGSNVGTNPPSLIPPGSSTIYTLTASREGNNLMYSTAATTGGEGDGGTLPHGLFGSVNVEAAGAEWYRSQVTEAEMKLATVGTTPKGQPIINYDAVYPITHPKAGKPILKMLNGDTIVHTDLNAIISRPNMMTICVHCLASRAKPRAT